MSDFECAPLRAIEQVFPAASKSGCMFHMGQSLFRKWRRAGMEAFYADPLVGELSRKTFRNILALALIPIEEVRHAFQLVVQHAPNGLQAFLAYFAQNYIGLTRRQQEEGANAFLPENHVQPPQDLSTEFGFSSLFVFYVFI
uniref:MULE transposase domain-containing protein n=1 Tax=Meloidogyne incognita TaxID=6306 RepID=A0A914MFK2_MELIC